MIPIKRGFQPKEVLLLKYIRSKGKQPTGDKCAGQNWETTAMVYDIRLRFTVRLEKEGMTKVYGKRKVNTRKS